MACSHRHLAHLVYETHQISKVIVVHALLTSFVQSLLAPAPVVVSPVCEGMPVEECNGVMGEYIKMLCPTLCIVDEYGFNEKGELVKIVISAVKEALNENEEALDEVVVSPVCEGIPVEACDGVMGEYIKMLCPTLCFADKYGLNKKGELLKIVVSAVKEALNENEENLDEVVASPVCEGMPVEECDGVAGEHIKILCPTLCFADEYGFNEKGELLKIVVSAVKEALNENEEALDDVVVSPVCEGIPVEECNGVMGEYIKMLCPTMCFAAEYGFNEKGELLKIVVSAVKEALNENEEALDEVVASPVCNGIPVEECDGVVGEYIKKLCPIMCAAASPVCEGIPVEECNGVMGEYIKKLCPTMCTADQLESDEIALDSITSVQKVAKTLFEERWFMDFQGNVTN